MDKQKLMQFLSDAIDKGANISILFYGSGENKEKAELVTKEFSQIISDANIRELEDNGHNWFRTENHQFGMSHFYDIKPTHFMEEDIDLTGGVEDVG